MSPSAFDWQRLREELQPDGALRDIYVHGADEQLWERFLTALPRSQYEWRLRHRERSIAGPLRQFGDAAKLCKSEPVLLQINLSRTLTLACHFFTAQQIELDVAPNDLQSKDAVGMLIGFMKWLARALNRAVVLTHENRPEDVILRIENTACGTAMHPQL